MAYDQALIDQAVIDFTSNVDLQLQQRGSKLRPLCSQGNYTGKQAQVVDQVGAITATKVAGRFTPIGRTDTPMDQRWVFPTDYEVKPQMVDNFDKLRVKIEVQGPYTMSAANALGRGEDDEIIAAYFGDAKTGVNGGTTTSFGTVLTTTAGGLNVAVATGGAAACGLNVAKLREAVRSLKSAENDPSVDPFYSVLTSIQHDNLLADPQVTSGDFGWKEAPVLVGGKVTHFMGVDFTRCERLQNGTDDSSASARMIPLYAKSGMHFGIWGDIQHSIDRYITLTSQPWGVYSTMTVGATRTEEAKVRRIWCKE